MISGVRVAIDASNLRQGGGITHLVQLLAAADPAASGVGSVTVYGARSLIDLLPAAPWLTCATPAALDGGGAARACWQQYGLARAARRSADVLFSPGGTYLGAFRPFVTMFRNMLPFDRTERRRYGTSRMRLKLEVLRLAQRATFRRADGIIFLTEHARSVIHGANVRIRGRETVIAHGLDPRFFVPPGAQRPISAYSSANPYRWLYVSAIHHYKRMPSVVEAIGRLRAEGYPVALDLVGPAHPAAVPPLMDAIGRVDPSRAFITVRGAVSHHDLPRAYRDADAFVFASTSENMPNSLLEAMAAGLPIACSDREPMSGLLKGAGVLFDPDRPETIADAMRSLMRDAAERGRVAAAAHVAAQEYSWSRCARDTFDFLAEVRVR